MDLPNEIRLYNEQLNAKGGKCTLVAVSDLGFYEVKMVFGNNTHRVLVPINNSVVIFQDPEPVFLQDADIER